MDSNIPINQVKAMKAQGLDNNQIIQALQRDGFSSSQIFDALNQVELEQSSPGVPSPQPSNMPPPPPVPPSPDVNSQGIPSNQSPPLTPNPQSQPSNMPPPPPVPPSGEASVSTEELVEAIIDEKWNDLVKDITTIVEWKNQAQRTITSLEQQFKDLKDQFDKLHQALIAKIGEYDKNILDVGSEVKAMEKVFSKVLPVFTANVAELDRITKTLKLKSSSSLKKSKQSD